MFTNELKKGTRVLLRNGWYATLEDNMKGNIRLATVEGYVTEMGSVYSHDIVRYRDANGIWGAVQHTPAQEKLRARVDRFGM
jgi:hypothetical protein